MMTLQRIHNLQSSLRTLKCDALLIDDPINLEYLTGLKLSAGKLFIYADAALLCVDGRYIEDSKEKCPCPVELLTAEKTLFSYLRPQIKSLGFITEQTLYKTFLELEMLTSEKSITLVPVENPVKLLRAIKDDHEIQLLEDAAALGSLGYDFVLNNLKEGVTEAELAFALEFFWRNNGGEGLAFDPIIAFGANSSKPHYRAGSAQLKKGDTVLIDIGVVRNGYHSDMTRVVFFGEPHPKILEIYPIVREAQQAAFDLCKPGTPLGDLDDAARNLIKGKGYGEAFSHSLGHGVGLEIHEYPFIRRPSPQEKTPLKAGMAITIEPGIYLPGIGGVRIEDLVVITDQGHLNLTKRPTTLTLLRTSGHA